MVKDRIKSLILEKHKSISSFSKIIGLTETTIHSFLKEKEGGKFQTLLIICWNLKISPVAVLYGEILPLDDHEISGKMLHNGTALKNIVRANYSSDYDFADVAGIAHSTLTYIYRDGTYYSRIGTLTKICQHLSINYKFLITGEIVHEHFDGIIANKKPKTTKSLYIGGRIKSLRKLQGLSQRELATKLNISQKKLSLIEQDKTGYELSLNELVGLCKALNVSADMVLGLKDIPQL